MQGAPAMAQQGPQAGVGPVTIDTAHTVGDMRELFHRAELVSQGLHDRMINMKAEFDGNMARLQADLVRAQNDAAAAQQQAQTSKQIERIDLIDIKAMSPTHFDGNKFGDFRPWGKRMKAFCNAKKRGFREALDMAEKSTTEITAQVVAAWNWQGADEANSKLFDLLITVCDGEAQQIVEKNPGQGFEAWRQLAQRFNPIGETYTFDKMNSLMHQPRCKTMAELPGAIDKWEQSVKQYEERSSELFPEVMKMPVLMQMVPAKNLEQILYKYRMGSDKNYQKFSQNLVEFSIESRYEARRAGGNDMDVDALARAGIITEAQKSDPNSDHHDDYYTEEQWALYENELNGKMAAAQEELNWLGKGGSKGGAKGKGGKGKGGPGKGGALISCLWCGKAGHMKKECRAFAKWKEDKDAERLKNGQPAYVPRTPAKPLASLEADYAPYDFRLEA